eukprot:TRINITY_DN11461_c0_g1::TRINITY_DN11461_c0_g1_i1::g.10917::m.10917 TRINITY_DN11461_c0_g1::TRINITY_DN11461_c0_g1_i1::g.10917  ORF type:complete len:174 (-),score=-0.92,EI24/PF07264.6/9.8e-09,DUF4112/PF13430.1/0.18,DUF4112/PF13430.1/3e+02,DUF2207/PF09972.4/12,DUF2207/PF09972.4/5.7,DUF3353/PF11833.3/1.5,DUF3353/PF11833.3/8.9e+02 TRINITY_DN11461_c0_g1_i1:139-609(-)
MEHLTNSIRNVGRLLLFSFIALLVSLLPVIGSYLSIVLNFIFLYKKVGNLPMAAIFSLTLLLPGIKTHSRQILTLVLAARSLARELLDPYLSRCYKFSQQSQILKRHSAMLLGFFLPLLMCLSFPYIGTLFLIIAQSAAALMAYHMIRAEGGVIAP